MDEKQLRAHILEQDTTIRDLQKTIKVFLITAFDLPIIFILLIFSSFLFLFVKSVFLPNLFASSDNCSCQAVGYTLFVAYEKRRFVITSCSAVLTALSW